MSSYHSDKLFRFKVTVTLTFDLKINRGHLLVTPSLHVKFEGHGRRHSDKLFAFKVTVTLTFDLMTSKSIQFVA